jgi:hypothetical protein
MIYPWYEQIKKSDNLMQGDFVPDCPIIIPPEDFQGDKKLNVKLTNSIILSQSCDLEHNKIDIVLVCPYYNLETLLENHPDNKQNSNKTRTRVIDNLKQGHYHSYHLMQKDINLNIADNIVVDFRNVYGIGYDFLKQHIYKLETRIRLLPPYREYLSQAFARYFMRVGLPIAIDC